MRDLMMMLSRAGRRSIWLVVVGALVMGGCSASVETSQSEEAVNPEVSRADDAPALVGDAGNTERALFDRTQTPRTAGTDEQLSADGLRAAIAATGELPALRFREVSSSGPADGPTRYVLREGVTDLGDGDGIGMLAILDQEPERLLPHVTGHDLQRVSLGLHGDFVVYHDMFWHRTPQRNDDVTRWIMVPVDRVPGSDLPVKPQEATDASYYLDRISEAILGEAQATSVFPDGTRRVTVELDAAIIGQFAVGGEQAVLAADGTGAEDLENPDFTILAAIDISDDGHIAYLEADVAQWWVAYLQAFGLTDEVLEGFGLPDYAATYSIAFAQVDDEVAIVPPCLDVGDPGCGCEAPVYASISLDGDEQADKAQALFAATRIPAGTAVADLVEQAAQLLDSSPVPPSSVCDSTLSAISELDDYAGLVLLDDVEPFTTIDSRQFGPLGSLAPAWVMVASANIPAGTPMSVLVRDFSDYLFQEEMRQELIDADALQGHQDLRALEGLVLNRLVEPGEQLQFDWFDDSCPLTGLLRESPNKGDRQVLVAIRSIEAGTAVQDLLDDSSTRLMVRTARSADMCDSTISSVAELAELAGQQSLARIWFESPLDRRLFGE